MELVGTAVPIGGVVVLGVAVVAVEAGAWVVAAGGTLLVVGVGVDGLHPTRSATRINKIPVNSKPFFIFLLLTISRIKDIY